MTKEWQNKCTFLNPQNSAVESEIEGEKVRFYPVSVGKLFELRAIAQPLAKALMSLMSSNTDDSGVNRGSDEQGQPFEAITPPSPEIVKLRYEQRAESIKELTDALSSEENLEIVGGVIMDSMREVFPPKDPTNPSPKDFIFETPAPVLPSLVRGVVKANEGVLGKFLGNAGSLLENAVEKVAARAKEASAESQEQTKTG